MKILRQFLLILLFSCLGELLHYWIPWPVPASIYGMVLLFSALALKIVRAEDMELTGSFLVSMLPLLFVPALVNLLESWEAVRSAVVPILVIIFASTIFVFAVSGWVTQWMISRKGGNKHD